MWVTSQPRAVKNSSMKSSLTSASEYAGARNVVSLSLNALTSPFTFLYAVSRVANGL